MTYEKCTVEQFMDCWFHKDYSKISLDEFKIIYASYQDVSGLYLTEDFEKYSFIHHLSSRINYIKLFVKLQRYFLVDFEMAFIRDFEYVKNEYGYGLKWNNDIKDFEKQLEKIESREIQNEIFLEEKIKELEDSRKDSKKKETLEDDNETLKKSKHSFMRMINSLCKMGYNIVESVTSVEKFALMIRQQMDENEQSSNAYGSR